MAKEADILHGEDGVLCLHDLHMQPNHSFANETTYSDQVAIIVLYITAK